ncbi:phosphoribosylglycinamide formyltransferase [Shinella sp. SUS2]|jgi:phosphoribosylglycinamide formyltransferase-1|uniref:phosphoribosylglycinamide formyltransferase n=1 Tax=unclassified Shinella TaxID=2643062 RepID=UPI0003C560CC|nr:MULTISPECIES: phosphoribosylglycinamide formyltransferase [unclassified Shinella]MCA0344802.1 phosphoribosylglycinamide formyltransferase [Pseudomonadota bacterium]EYR80815.1 phosphoribosylglycinamide formyltransferase PurN [Shinella sp. DD12]KNY17580.1 phosphoribosylglycinamide formyltransferase [Shinella sp. SUS2]KOC75042.1 phosphoribosylglycinamide formyltransferase [Shinella sp. GWS1]MDG4671261.1 phosphoribosylglycinamide formyltransferase [Shinella sp. 838]
MSGSRKRVVAFISGGGSNMLALAKAAEAPDFPAEIVAVFSDKAEAGGLAKAEALGIATRTFLRKDYASKDAHEAAILEALETLSPDLICLAGYMRLISGAFVNRYEGRILNIHPSLLPLFPGLHTHQRAIDAGMRVAGCTVHFVTEGMDEGPVVVQAAVPVLPGDTSDTLAARVLTVEHRSYPLALRLVAEGKVRMEGGKAVSAGDLPQIDGAHLISPAAV